MFKFSTFNLTLFTFLILLSSACDKKEDDTQNPSDKPLSVSTTEATDKNGNVYKVGLEQVSSNNQNPFVEKYNSAGTLLWKKIHASTGVDERAVLVSIAEDGTTPFVVFTVDGGSNDSNFITKKETESGAFDNVFLNSYGRASGAAKVAVIARLNPENGKISKATFLMSRTKEGNINATEKTNTFVVDNFDVTSNAVRIEGRSWFLPPSKDATASNFVHHPDATEENKSGSSWKMYIEMPLDLSKISRSDVVK